MGRPSKIFNGEKEFSNINEPARNEMINIKHTDDGDETVLHIIKEESTNVSLRSVSKCGMKRNVW